MKERKKNVMHYDIHTNGYMQEGRQPGEQIFGRICRLGGTQTDRQIDRQTDKQTDNQRKISQILTCFVRPSQY